MSVISGIHGGFDSMSKHYIVLDTDHSHFHLSVPPCQIDFSPQLLYVIPMCHKAVYWVISYFICSI